MLSTAHTCGTAAGCLHCIVSSRPFGAPVRPRCWSSRFRVPGNSSSPFEHTPKRELQKCVAASRLLHPTGNAGNQQDPFFWRVRRKAWGRPPQTVFVDRAWNWPPTQLHYILIDPALRAGSPIGVRDGRMRASAGVCRLGASEGDRFCAFLGLATSRGSHSTSWRHAGWC